MSTSGTYTYTRTAGQIITQAYEDLGVIQPGISPSTAQSTKGLAILNIVAKQYQGESDSAPGMKIHTRQRIQMWLAKGQHSYLVGPAATDAKASTSWGRTTISADEAAAQTVLSITSNTDAITFPGSTITMTSGDFIGIELNDGTIHWTTISGTPTTTATVVTQLPSAASAGKYVWWFTARAQRFPTLEAAVLRDVNYNDSPLTIYEDVRQYDFGVASKYGDGTPTAFLVEPLRTQTRVTLNSQPTDVKQTIILTALYPSENYDATTDDIAFPQEAFGFLGWEVAFRLAPSAGRWTSEMQKNYDLARSLYLNLNPENSTLFFQCNA